MLKFSIIIPAYNCGSYIQKCVESIQKQNYKNLEIIIINDGSTDNTKDEIEKIALTDSRIIIINQKNQGVSKARNTGIKVASGDYIHFIDADDYILPGLYKKIASIIDDTSAEFIRFDYQFYDGITSYNNNEVKLENVLLDNNEININIIPQILDEKMKAYVWQMIVKRDKVVEFDNNLKLLEDEKYYLDILPKIELAYFTSTVFYNYNISNISSATRSSEKILLMMENMLEGNKRIKKSLINSKLDSISNLKIFDSRMAHSFTNYLEIIYNTSKNYKDATIKYKSIIQKYDLFEIFSNIDYSYLKPSHKITTFLILHEYFILIHIIYILKKIKRRIVHEK